MEEVVIQFVIDFVAKYPIATALFVVMGVFRSVFKPFFVFADTFVASTPSKKDDELLAGFKGSKIYKGLAFVVDYLLSIKLPGLDKK